MLSIVIPTADEVTNTFFQSYLLQLKALPNVEVICVDKSLAFSRAERLNIGFNRSLGDLILFHHPRSVVDLNGIQFLAAQENRKIWGGFTHRFDLEHPILNFTSWYSNYFRGRIRSIFYLDHCIFFHRSFFKELPAVEIFEDTLLSLQLKKIQRPVLLKFKSTTSSIRFVKNGIYRQVLRNQVSKIAFKLNISHSTINKFYEKNLNLNNDEPPRRPGE